jgi:hypothetical protein
MNTDVKRWIEKTKRKLEEIEARENGIETPHEWYAGRKRKETRPPLLNYPPGESPIERGICPVWR